MLMIAARIAEIYFAVLDDRVRPIGYVEAAVRPKADVDLAERDICGAKQVRHFFRLKRRAYVRECEPNHSVRPEIAGENISLPIGREHWAVHDLKTRELRIVAGANA